MPFGLDNMSNVQRWSIASILLFMILLGTSYPILSIAAFGVLTLLTYVVGTTDFIFLYLTITPLATIFRTSATGQSFLTYILLFYVLLDIAQEVFIQQEVDDSFVVLLIFFIMVVAVQLVLHTMDWKRTIKLMANILVIRNGARTNIEQHHKNYFLGYITGILVASFATLIQPRIFQLQRFVTSKTLSTGYGFGSVDRFSALYDDPNYYGVNIILCLCLVVILFSRKEIGTISAALLGGILFYFGIITYSKTITIMMALPVLVLIKENQQNKRYIFQIASVLVVAIVLAGALSGIFPIFDIIIARFQTGDGSISSMTTGRTEIWMDYFQYLKSNPWKLIFGSGLGAGYLSTRKGIYAAHNFYIESLYHLGIVGGSLLFFVFGSILQSTQIPIKRNIIQYSGIIGIAIMYCTLNQLFSFELPVHLLTAIFIWNLSVEHSTSQLTEQDKQRR